MSTNLLIKMQFLSSSFFISFSVSIHPYPLFFPLSMRLSVWFSSYICLLFSLLLINFSCLFSFTYSYFSTYFPRIRFHSFFLSFSTLLLLSSYISIPTIIHILHSYPTSLSSCASFTLALRFSHSYSVFLSPSYFLFHLPCSPYPPSLCVNKAGRRQGEI